MMKSKTLVGVNLFRMTLHSGGAPIMTLKEQFLRSEARTHTEKQHFSYDASSYLMNFL